MYSLLAWILSNIATITSLYMSEVLNYTPCSLCWYCRIFLFPLPILLFQAIYFNKKEFLSYILSLPLFGLIPSSILIFENIFSCYTCKINHSFPLLIFLTFLMISILLRLEILRGKNACSQTK